MATTTEFSVYDGHGDLQAKCVDPIVAAAVVGLTGEGTVRWQRRVVWTEGSEDIEAGESYDTAAGTMWERVDAIIDERNERYAAEAVAALQRVSR